MFHSTDLIVGDPGSDPRSGLVGDHAPEVEFRHLRYFVGVAEEMHFGRAATRLFITQSALSQSIAKLERTLRVQLLERSRQGVQLTEAGVEFLSYARRTLADTQYALQRVRSVGMGLAGVLRIGVALLAEQLIAPALAAFHAGYPGIVLDRATAVSERLIAQVADGGLQAAFVYQVPTVAALASVQWELVRRGQLAAVMSETHELAGSGSIALRQLREETFLVNPRVLAPGALQGLKLMCAEFGGFDPKVAESAATSMPALDPDWQLVRKGAAIAVTAEETARSICPDGLVVVVIEPPPSFALAAAWRRGEQSAALDRLLDFVRSYRDTHGWTSEVR